MTMRNRFPNRILLAAALCLGTSAVASPPTFLQTYSSGFQNGGLIPDGSLEGWSDTRTVGLADNDPISTVRLTLNLSGGYNGDLYAYLSHGNGFVVLLNRVGVGQAQGDAFGFGGSGMSLTLASDGAHDDIHWYGFGSMPTGTYLPDGRAIDPLSAPNLFDAAATTASFATMAGLQPNGAWTLFVADVSAGGGQSLLTGWSLEIVTVPEPATTALLALGIVVVVAAACWSRSSARFR
jgi:subtilisin-like proprotein convertase family protein